MPFTARRAVASVAAATLAVALSTTLAGCAFPGGSGAGGAGAPASPSASPTQTVAEACALVRESVDDAAHALGSLDTSDPQAAAAAVSALSERIQDAAATIDNTDVAAVLPGLQSGFAAAAAALQATAGGDLSQLPALQQSATDIQSSLGEFAELCPAD